MYLHFLYNCFQDFNEYTVKYLQTDTETLFKKKNVCAIMSQKVFEEFFHVETIISSQPS